VRTSALLTLLVAACGAPRTPTPGGLAIRYSPNEPRLAPEKARELDARHAALLECLPPESFCRTEPPTFSIANLDCDTFVDPWDGRRVRGRFYPNGSKSIRLPGSLGAAAHEMTHYYTCETDVAGEAYRGLWLFKCGDQIDVAFRRLHPPTKCEGER
jgi:hypothetical protein